MIELRVQGVLMKRLDHANLLEALQIFLDKQKFYGKIELSYEAGVLKNIKSTQTFTPDLLIEHLTT